MLSIKEKLKGLIQKILSYRIITFLVKKFYSIINPLVIVRIDGGICSQIHFYLIGRYFMEQGFKVRYDLDWYQKYGKDIFGVYERNFDLAKLNSEIKIKSVCKTKALLYKFFLSADYDYFKVSYGNTSWKDLTPPVYLGGYYHDFKELYTVMLPKFFPLESMIECLNDENRVVLELITKSNESVAIHVRRGDLAVFNEAYGMPCSIQYFSKAISYFQKVKADFTFFIFSDEPEWVRNELLPQMPDNENYFIIDINGSDKGYMDLVLMASCKHMITSKGSLGKYAALINWYEEKIVIINDDISEKKWLDIFPTVIEVDNK